MLPAAAVEISSNIRVYQNDAYHGAGLLFSETPSDADVATMEAFEYWRRRWAGYTDDDCSPPLRQAGEMVAHGEGTRLMPTTAPAG